MLQLKVPIFLGVNVPTSHRAPGLVLFDDEGKGSITYQNPNGLVGLFACQVVVFRAEGLLAGTSTAAFL